MRRATCTTQGTLVGPSGGTGLETLQTRDVMQCGVWGIEKNEQIGRAHV